MSAFPLTCSRPQSPMPSLDAHSRRASTVSADSSTLSENDLDHYCPSASFASTPSPSSSASSSSSASTTESRASSIAAPPTSPDGGLFAPVKEEARWDEALDIDNRDQMDALMSMGTSVHACGESFVPMMTFQAQKQSAAFSVALRADVWSVKLFSLKPLRGKRLNYHKQEIELCMGLEELTCPSSTWFLHRNGQRGHLPHHSSSSSKFKIRAGSHRRPEEADRPIPRLLDGSHSTSRKLSPSQNQHYLNRKIDLSASSLCSSASSSPLSSFSNALRRYIPLSPLPDVRPASQTASSMVLSHELTPSSFLTL
jgi:hypothetical protein